MKYRHKPTDVDAEQWNEGKTVPGVCDGCMAGMREVGGPHVHTRQGVVKVAPGDFIIRGASGEFYPCKPDIFAENYEPVAEPEEAPK